MSVERLELKAAFTTDDAGAIEGVAWPFGAPDRTGDEILPTAFASSVGKRLPMLSGHSEPVGVWDDISVDGEGLKVKGRLLIDDVPEARSVRALAKEGVMALSIGFMTKKSAPRKGGGRTISDLEMVECSIVAVPANAGARITNVKELDMTAVIEPKTVELEVKAADLKAANDNIEALTKRLDEAETKLARPNINRGAASDNEPSEERKAFEAYLRIGDKAGAETLKTLTVSTDSQGGYLAPAEFATEFVRNLVQFSPIRAYASVRATASPSVIYPVRTSVTNALWRSEIAAQASSDVAFGQAEIPVNEISTYVDVSNQLLADSAGSAEAEVRQALVEDFAAKEASAFLIGSGSNMPKGLLVDAGIGTVTSAGAAAVTFDDVISLFYSLPAIYRNAGTFGMNSKTLAAVRKLRDSQGQYLWQPSLQVGQPESILGRPVVELLEMDDIATGKSPIVFGDLTGYRIVDRISMSILPNPYLLATNGITRFHATRRVGGAVLQPAKIKKLLQP